MTHLRNYPTGRSRSALRHSGILLLVAAATSLAPPAFADNGNTVVPNNARLNNAVYVNINTSQRQNGCPVDSKMDNRLTEAARRHTLDVLNNPDINGDIGSDGSTPQDRARDAGFPGRATETVAIVPALAINGIDVLGQWWWDPPSRAIMQDCANTAIGVWSENSLNRSVLVATYGQPT
nr:CAP domain-containing protein [Mycobacterium vicinigordonae]